jgi:hypothetical protein
MKIISNKIYREDLILHCMTVLIDQFDEMEEAQNQFDDLDFDTIENHRGKRELSYCKVLLVEDQYQLSFGYSEINKAPKNSAVEVLDAVTKLLLELITHQLKEDSLRKPPTFNLKAPAYSEKMIFSALAKIKEEVPFTLPAQEFAQTLREHFRLY